MGFYLFLVFWLGAFSGGTFANSGLDTQIRNDCSIDGTQVAMSDKQNIPCSDLSVMYLQYWIPDVDSGGYAQKINSTDPSTIVEFYEKNPQVGDCPVIRHVCCTEFMGIDCNTLRCDPKCENGGMCTLSGRCVCVSGYAGPSCQYEANDAGEPIAQCFHTATCSGDILKGGKTMPRSECEKSGGSGFGYPKNCISTTDLSNSLFMDTMVNSDAPIATCMIYGRSAIRSFDGRQFNAFSDCRHILAMVGPENWEDAQSQWSIETQIVDCDDSMADCKRKLTVSFNDISVKAVGNEVSINGKVIKTTEAFVHPNSDINIQREGSFTYLSTSAGFKLRWDDALSLAITVDRAGGFGNVIGLCGNYNGDPLDDFTPLGMEPTANLNIDNFLASFKNRETECIEQRTSASNPCLGSNNKKLADQLCSKNLLSEAFSGGHAVLYPLMQIRSCEFDICSLPSKNVTTSATTVMCHYLGAYSKELADRGMVLNWRRDDLCPKTCDGRKRWSECMSRCAPTCSMQHRVQEKQCYDDCVPGCECPHDTFLDDRVCVRSELCPCYQNRVRYAAGETTTQQCNKCTCVSGQWDCETNVCTGTCSAMGHFTYRTFDRKVYDFHGKCDYVLVEPINEEDRATSKLSISMKKFDCIDSTEYGVCNVRITINSGKSIIILESGNGKDISVNGLIAARLPYRNNDIHLYNSGLLWLVVEGYSGWQVQFNRESTLHITLPASFADKVRGLCGTFNFNNQDDFMTSYGLTENDLFSFAVSYRTYMDQCDDRRTKKISQCLKNQNMKEQAVQTCKSMKSLSGPFASCHGVLSPEDQFAFYSQCVENTCAANTIRGACVFLAEMAHECINKGANVSWVDDSFLRKQCADVIGKCDNGREYTECAGSCDSTCESHNEYARQKCDDKTEPCTSGCVCPSGTVFDLHQETCVQKDECSCFDPLRQKYFAPGKSMMRACNQCLCKDGVFKCQNHECTENICPGNQKLLDQVSPCRRTCMNFDRIDPNTCPATTHRGCGCADGYVLQGDDCVLPSQCPCWHSSREYSSGSTFDSGCTSCICVGKYWNCSSLMCEATCKLTGDPHYITFDGSSYSFESRCEHVLAKHLDNDGSPIFEITVQNIPCEASGVPCTKSIDIHLHSPDHKLISLLKGRNLHIDGAEASLPYQEPEIGLKIFMTGSWLYVITKQDFYLRWDGGTRVELTAKPNLKFKPLFGLCGNFNGRQEDDLTTPSGDIESDTVEFGASWKVIESCVDLMTPNNETDDRPACQRNKHRKPWAERACRIITHGTQFDRCRKAVEDSKITRFHRWCEDDACRCDSGGDCECLCTSLSTFADMCSDAGYPVRWRSRDVCPLQCENQMVYQSCGAMCPTTCRSLSAPIDDTCTAECVEGCFCPTGLVQDGDRCIEAPQCPCYYENVAEPPGSMLKKHCQDCLCLNGTWICTGEMCLNETTCGPNQFRCLSDARCISNDWVCDLVNDCDDGSDELNCITTCLPQEWRCSNGECIPREYYCDGQSDCDDSSDEHHCPLVQCGVDEFMCSSGTCIPMRFKCDGELDCGAGDHSDEESCEFCSAVRSFLCDETSPNGECLSLSQRCDGHDDCGDMSDEIGCANCTCTSAFTCGDCQCIDVLQRCDGMTDCDTDEINCPCADGLFSCNNGTCLEMEHICDGIRDCSEAEDEIHPTCERRTTTLTTISNVTCGPDMIVCKDGTCHQGKICDDIYDCLDKSDERGCFTTTLPHCLGFICLQSQRCISVDDVCDGIKDCVDESDETSCTTVKPHECRAGQFECIESHECVDHSFLCDGDMDCADNSDEAVMLCGTSSVLPTTPESTMRTTSGRVCPYGFSHCDDMLQCIPIVSFCNDKLDCRDESDESHNCMTPSPAPERLCEYFVERDELKQPGSKPAENATITWPDSHTVVFDFFQPASVNEVVVVASADSYVHIELFDTVGNTVYDEITSFTWFTYEMFFDKVYTNIAKGKITVDSALSPGLRPVFEFLRLVACAEEPHECRDGFSPCSNKQCMWEEYFCDGEEDCDDGSDEAELCVTFPPRQDACEHYVTRNDMENVNLESPQVIWEDGTIIRWQNDRTMVIFDFGKPADITEVAFVLSGNATLKLTLYDEFGALLTDDMSQTETRMDTNWTLPFVVPVVKKAVLQLTGDGDILKESPIFEFAMVVGCIEGQSTPSLLTTSMPQLLCDTIDLLEVDIQNAMIYGFDPIETTWGIIDSSSNNVHISFIDPIRLTSIVLESPVSEPIMVTVIDSDGRIAMERPITTNLLKNFDLPLQFVSEIQFPTEEAKNVKALKMNGCTHPLPDKCIKSTITSAHLELLMDSTAAPIGVTGGIIRRNEEYLELILDKPVALDAISIQSSDGKPVEVAIYDSEGRQVANEDISTTTTEMKGEKFDPSLEDVLKIQIMYNEGARIKQLTATGCEKPIISKDCVMPTVTKSDIKKLYDTTAGPIELTGGIVRRDVDYLELVLNEPVALDAITIQSTDGKPIEVTIYDSEGRQIATDNIPTTTSEMQGEKFDPPLEGVLTIRVPNDDAKQIKQLIIRGCKKPVEPKDCVMPAFDTADVQHFSDPDAVPIDLKGGIMKRNEQYLELVLNEPLAVDAIIIQSTDGKPIELIIYDSKDRQIATDDIPTTTSEPRGEGFNPPLEGVLKIRILYDDAKRIKQLTVRGCKKPTIPEDCIMTTFGTSDVNHLSEPTAAPIELSGGIIRRNEDFLELVLTEPVSVDAITIQSTNGKPIEVTIYDSEGRQIATDDIPTVTSEMKGERFDPPLEGVLKIGILYIDAQRIKQLTVRGCKKPIVPKDCVMPTFGTSDVNHLSDPSAAPVDLIGGTIRRNEDYLEMVLNEPVALDAITIQSNDGKPIEVSIFDSKGRTIAVDEIPTTTSELKGEKFNPAIEGVLKLRILYEDAMRIKQLTVRGCKKPIVPKDCVMPSFGTSDVYDLSEPSAAPIDLMDATIRRDEDYLELLLAEPVAVDAITIQSTDGKPVEVTVYDSMDRQIATDDFPTASSEARGEKFDPPLEGVLKIRILYDDAKRIKQLTVRGCKKPIVPKDCVMPTFGTSDVNHLSEPTAAPIELTGGIIRRNEEYLELLITEPVALDAITIRSTDGKPVELTIYDSEGHLIATDAIPTATLENKGERFDPPLEGVLKIRILYDDAKRIKQLTLRGCKKPIVPKDCVMPTFGTSDVNRLSEPTAAPIELTGGIIRRDDDYLELVLNEPVALDAITIQSTDGKPLEVTISDSEGRQIATDNIPTTTSEMNGEKFDPPLEGVLKIRILYEDAKRIKQLIVKGCKKPIIPKDCIMPTIGTSDVIHLSDPTAAPIELSGGIIRRNEDFLELVLTEPVSVDAITIQSTNGKPIEVTIYDSEGRQVATDDIPTVTSEMKGERFDPPLEGVLKIGILYIDAQRIKQLTVRGCKKPIVPKDCVMPTFGTSDVKHLSDPTAAPIDLAGGIVRRNEEYLELVLNEPVAVDAITMQSTDGKPVEVTIYDSEGHLIASDKIPTTTSEMRGERFDPPLEGFLKVRILYEDAKRIKQLTIRGCIKPVVPKDCIMPTFGISDVNHLSDSAAAPIDLTGGTMRRNDDFLELVLNEPVALDAITIQSTDGKPIDLTIYDSQGRQIATDNIPTTTSEPTGEKFDPPLEGVLKIRILYDDAKRIKQLTVRGCKKPIVPKDCVMPTFGTSDVGRLSDPTAAPIDLAGGIVRRNEEYLELVLNEPVAVDAITMQSTDGKPVEVTIYDSEGHLIASDNIPTTTSEMRGERFDPPVEGVLKIKILYEDAKRIKQLTIRGCIKPVVPKDCIMPTFGISDVNHLSDSAAAPIDLTGSTIRRNDDFLELVLNEPVALDAITVKSTDGKPIELTIYDSQGRQIATDNIPTTTSEPTGEKFDPPLEGVLKIRILYDDAKRIKQLTVRGCKKPIVPKDCVMPTFGTSDVGRLSELTAAPIELAGGIIRRNDDYLELVINEPIALDAITIQSTDGKPIEVIIYDGEGRQVATDSIPTATFESKGEKFDPPLDGVLTIRFPYADAKRIRQLTARGCKKPIVPKDCIMPAFGTSDVNRLSEPTTAPIELTGGIIRREDTYLELVLNEPVALDAITIQSTDGKPLEVTISDSEGRQIAIDHIPTHTAELKGEKFDPPLKGVLTIRILFDDAKRIKQMAVRGCKKPIVPKDCVMPYFGSADVSSLSEPTAAPIELTGGMIRRNEESLELVLDQPVALDAITIQSIDGKPIEVSIYDSEGRQIATDNIPTGTAELKGERYDPPLEGVLTIWIHYDDAKRIKQLIVRGCKKPILPKDCVMSSFGTSDVSQLSDLTSVPIDVTEGIMKRNEEYMELVLNEPVALDAIIIQSTDGTPIEVAIYDSKGRLIATDDIPTAISEMMGENFDPSLEDVLMVRILYDDATRIKKLTVRGCKKPVIPKDCLMPTVSKSDIKHLSDPNAPPIDLTGGIIRRSDDHLELVLNEPVALEAITVQSNDGNPIEIAVYDSEGRHIATDDIPTTTLEMKGERFDPPLDGVLKIRILYDDAKRIKQLTVRGCKKPVIPKDCFMPTVGKSDIKLLDDPTSEPINLIGGVIRRNQDYLELVLNEPVTIDAITIQSTDGKPIEVTVYDSKDRLIATDDIPTTISEMYGEKLDPPVENVLKIRVLYDNAARIKQLMVRGCKQPDVPKDCVMPYITNSDVSNLLDSAAAPIDLTGGIIRRNDDFLELVLDEPTDLDAITIQSTDGKPIEVSIYDSKGRKIATDDIPTTSSEPKGERFDPPLEGVLTVRVHYDDAIRIKQLTIRGCKKPIVPKDCVMPTFGTSDVNHLSESAAPPIDLTGGIVRRNNHFLELVLNEPVALDAITIQSTDGKPIELTIYDSQGRQIATDNVPTTTSEPRGERFDPPLEGVLKIRIRYDDAKRIKQLTIRGCKKPIVPKDCVMSTFGTSDVDHLSDSTATPIDLTDGIIRRNNDYLEFVLNEPVAVDAIIIQSTDGKPIEVTIYDSKDRQIATDDIPTTTSEPRGEGFNPPLEGVLKIRILYDDAKRIKQLTVRGCKKPIVPKDCVMPAFGTSDVNHLSDSTAAPIELTDGIIRRNEEYLELVLNEPVALNAIIIQSTDGKPIEVTINDSEGRPIATDDIPTTSSEPKGERFDPPLESVLTIRVLYDDAKRIKQLTIRGCKKPIVPKDCVMPTFGTSDVNHLSDPTAAPIDLAGGIVRRNEEYLELVLNEPVAVEAITMQSTDGKPVEVTIYDSEGHLIASDNIPTTTSEMRGERFDPPLEGVLRIRILYEDAKRIKQLTIRGCIKPVVPKDCIMPTFGISDVNHLSDSTAAPIDLTGGIIRRNDDFLELVLDEPTALDAITIQSTDGKPIEVGFYDSKGRQIATDNIPTTSSEPKGERFDPPLEGVLTVRVHYDDAIRIKQLTARGCQKPIVPKECVMSTFGTSDVNHLSDSTAAPIELTDGIIRRNEKYLELVLNEPVAINAIIIQSTDGKPIEVTINDSEGRPIATDDIPTTSSEPKGERFDPPLEGVLTIRVLYNDAKRIKQLTVRGCKKPIVPKDCVMPTFGTSDIKRLSDSTATPIDLTDGIIRRNNDYLELVLNEPVAVDAIIIQSTDGKPIEVTIYDSKDRQIATDDIPTTTSEPSGEGFNPPLEGVLKIRILYDDAKRIKQLTVRGCKKPIVPKDCVMPAFGTSDVNNLSDSAASPIDLTGGTIRRVNDFLELVFNEPVALDAITIKSTDGKSIEVTIYDSQGRQIATDNIPTTTSEPRGEGFNPPLEGVLKIRILYDDAKRIKQLTVRGCKKPIVPKDCVVPTFGTLDVNHLSDSTATPIDLTDGIIRRNNDYLELVLNEPVAVDAIIIQSTDGKPIEVTIYDSKDRQIATDDIPTTTSEPRGEGFNPPLEGVLKIRILYDDAKRIKQLTVRGCKKPIVPKDCVMPTFGTSDVNHLSDSTAAPIELTDGIIRRNEEYLELVLNEPVALNAIIIQSTDDKPIEVTINDSEGRPIATDDIPTTSSEPKGERFDPPLEGVLTIRVLYDDAKRIKQLTVTGCKKPVVPKDCVMPTFGTSDVKRLSESTAEPIDLTAGTIRRNDDNLELVLNEPVSINAITVQSTDGNPIKVTIYDSEGRQIADENVPTTVAEMLGDKFNPSIENVLWIRIPYDDAKRIKQFAMRGCKEPLVPKECIISTMSKSDISKLSGPDADRVNITRGSVGRNGDYMELIMNESIVLRMIAIESRDGHAIEVTLFNSNGQKIETDIIPTSTAEMLGHKFVHSIEDVLKIQMLYDDAIRIEQMLVKGCKQPEIPEPEGCIMPRIKDSDISNLADPNAVPIDFVGGTIGRNGDYLRIMFNESVALNTIAIESTDGNDIEVIIYDSKNRKITSDRIPTDPTEMLGQKFIPAIEDVLKVEILYDDAMKIKNVMIRGCKQPVIPEKCIMPIITDSTISALIDNPQSQSDIEGGIVVVVGDNLEVVFNELIVVKSVGILSTDGKDVIVNFLTNNLEGNLTRPIPSNRYEIDGTRFSDPIEEVTRIQLSMDDAKQVVKLVIIGCHVTAKECEYKLTNNVISTLESVGAVRIDLDTTVTGNQSKVVFEFKNVNSLHGITIEVNKSTALEVAYKNTISELKSLTGFEVADGKLQTLWLDSPKSASFLQVSLTEPLSAISFIKVHTCHEVTTTIQPESTVTAEFSPTTTMHEDIDCIYILDDNDLSRSSVLFEDAKAELVRSTGKIVFTFEEPREITTIKLGSSNEGVVTQIEVKNVNDRLQDVFDVKMGTEPEVEETSLPSTFRNIIELTVIFADNQLDNTRYIEVVACKEHPELSSTLWPSTYSSTSAYVCLEPLLQSIDSVKIDASSGTGNNPGSRARLGKDGWIPSAKDYKRTLTIDLGDEKLINGFIIRVQGVKEIEFSTETDLIKTIKSTKTNEDETIMLETSIMSAIVLIKLARIEANELVKLNVEVLGCEHPTTELTTLVPLQCLHFINPDIINAQEPIMTNDFAVTFINGSIVVLFTEPVALYDVILQSKIGLDFELGVSYDGDAFEPYLDTEQAKSAVIRSGDKIPFRNSISKLSPVIAIKLSSNIKPIFVSFEINACVERSSTVEPTSLTTEKGKGGGGGTFPTIGYPEFTLYDTEICSHPMNLSSSQFIEASSGEPGLASLGGSDAPSWTADLEDVNAFLIVDLGIITDITGFTIRTDTVLKFDLSAKTKLDDEFVFVRTLPEGTNYLGTEPEILNEIDFESTNIIQGVQYFKLQVVEMTDQTMVSMLANLGLSEVQPKGPSLAIDAKVCNPEETVPTPTYSSTTAGTTVSGLLTQLFTELSTWSIDYTGPTVTEPEEVTLNTMRTKKQPPPFTVPTGGKYSSSTTKQVTSATTARPGDWSVWSPWSNCDAACDSEGIQLRHRLCSDPYPSPGGLGCLGTADQQEKCLAECSTTPGIISNASTVSGFTGTPTQPAVTSSFATVTVFPEELCDHAVKRGDFESNTVKYFNNENRATIGADGVITFDFNENVEPTQITVKNQQVGMITITGYDENGQNIKQWTVIVDSVSTTTMPLSDPVDNIRSLKVESATSVSISTENMELLVVQACFHQTTTPGRVSETTPVPHNCDYSITGDRLKQYRTKEFEDGQTVTLTDNGLVVFEFTNEIFFTEIYAHLATQTRYLVNRYDKENNLISDLQLTATASDKLAILTKISTDVDVPVAKIEIEGKNGRLRPDEIISLTVIGCTHDLASTTPSLEEITTTLEPPSSTEELPQTTTESSTLEPKNCQIKNITQDLKTKYGRFDCVATGVTLTMCVGGCPSMEEIIMNPPYTKSNCDCCMGQYKKSAVEFDCEGRPTLIKVPHHVSCGCLSCK